MSRSTPSLARREREKAPEILPVELPVETKALPPPTPTIVFPPATRISFMEVIRDQFGEIVGLRPHYEDR